MTTSHSKLNPLVDGDLLVYRCGFACKEDEPLEYCLQTVKTCLGTILDSFPDRQWYKLYLSGKGNYREELSVTRVYKGNRDPNNKPKYYAEIKDYLTDAWGAEWINGREADDAVACEQFKHSDKSTCIVSIDKDLNQIPGYHYNWVKGYLYYVTMQEADKNFYTQLLTGDPVDNIQGIPKIGPKKAEKLLAGKESRQEMYQVACEQYQKYYGQDWQRVLMEMANLVWIQREEGKLWLPPS